MNRVSKYEIKHVICRRQLRWLWFLGFNNLFFFGCCRDLNHQMNNCLRLRGCNAFQSVQTESFYQPIQTNRFGCCCASTRTGLICANNATLIGSVFFWIHYQISILLFVCRRRNVPMCKRMSHFADASFCDSLNFSIYQNVDIQFWVSYWLLCRCTGFIMFRPTFFNEVCWFYGLMALLFLALKYVSSALSLVLQSRRNADGDACEWCGLWLKSVYYCFQSNQHRWLELFPGKL